MESCSQQWNFGAIRKVVVVWPEHEGLLEHLEYLAEMDDVTRWCDGRALRLVGEVDGMAPLVQRGDEETVYVVMEGERYGFTPVARSVPALARFLDEAASLWKDDPAAVVLRVTDAHLAFARSALERFAADNPGVDTSLWEDECFAGLTLGFPMP